MVKRAAMTKYLLTGLLLTSAVPPAATAAATDGRITAEGLIGYGIGFDSNNIYGFGFGARAGIRGPSSSTPAFPSSTTLVHRWGP